MKQVRPGECSRIRTEGFRSVRGRGEFVFFKQKTAYEILAWLEFRRVLFRSEVPFTLLLAIVAGIGELIPVVGPILSAIPAVIAGATNGVSTALAVAALYTVIQQVENQVLVPRIVGTTLRLHAAILMALLVIASHIGGLLLVILIAQIGRASCRERV